jgi:hypothetical protein
MEANIALLYAASRNFVTIHKKYVDLVLFCRLWDSDTAALKILHVAIGLMTKKRANGVWRVKFGMETSWTRPEVWYEAFL